MGQYLTVWLYEVAHLKKRFWLNFIILLKSQIHAVPAFVTCFAQRRYIAN